MSSDNVEIPEQWVHLGNDVLHAEWFAPIRNSFGFPKPLGGIWASPLRLNGKYISDWHEQSVRMGFATPEKACIFNLKSDARICVIDGRKDLERLMDTIGSPPSPLGESEFLSRRMQTLDFRKLAESYDILYLTEKGEFETRLPIWDNSYTLYGWDCESCIILNFDVIGKQKSVHLSKQRRVYSE